MDTAAEFWQEYKLRWKRRRLLFRALRKRRQIRPLNDRTATIRPTDILLTCTVRNEAIRLPFFMAHYRALGVTGSTGPTGSSEATATDGSGATGVGRPGCGGDAVPSRGPEGNAGTDGTAGVGAATDGAAGATGSAAYRGSTTKAITTPRSTTAPLATATTASRAVAPAEDRARRRRKVRGTRERYG